MKYLKLFENFSHNKIVLVNNIFIKYLVFDYFHKNNISAKEDFTGDFIFTTKSGSTEIAEFFPSLHWVFLFDQKKFFKDAFRGWIQFETDLDNLKVPIGLAMQAWIDYLTKTPEKRHLLKKII